MKSKRTTKEKVVRDLSGLHQSLLDSVYYEKDYKMIEGNKERFDKLVRTVERKMYDVETVKDAVIDMLNYANTDNYDEAIAYLVKRMKGGKE